MPRSSVEIYNVFDATKRADAIFELSQRFLRNKNYFWIFMGANDEGVFGTMKTGDGIYVSALKIRNCPEVVKIVATDDHRFIDNPTEALIGEAHLLPRGDLNKIKEELTEMGVNVRLFRK